MSDADDAFEEAKRRIERAQVEEVKDLDLSDLRHLERLPEAIGRLTKLKSLDLFNPITPLKISDISPLKNLSTLQNLDFDNTHVADLRPLLELPTFRDNESDAFVVHFRNTPATGPSEELSEISRIGVNKERHQKPRILTQLAALSRAIAVGGEPKQ